MTIFPQEIYEHIIDSLLPATTSLTFQRPFTPHVRPLLSCALVCRTWLPRCCHHLAHFRKLSAAAHLEVAAFAYKRYRTPALLQSKVLYVQGKDINDAATTWIGCLPLRLNSSAISQFAELSFWKVDIGKTHQSFPFTLSFFVSVTTLSFREVQFPTPRLFIRVIRAFPSLRILQTCKVEYVHPSGETAVGDEVYLCHRKTGKQGQLSWLDLKTIDSSLYTGFAVWLKSSPSISTTMTTLILYNAFWSTSTQSLKATQSLLSSSTSLHKVGLVVDGSSLPNTLGRCLTYLL